MGAGRAVGLLLVVLLMMPGAQANCGDTEYSHQGLCCVFCEAGTFVADHCNASHLRGKCDPCKEGKGFTPHANGLEECLPCKQCKEGQEIARPCNLTQDAECRCKGGYHCKDEDCKKCQRISEMHQDGKEMVANSTGATDPSLPNQGNLCPLWVIPVILIILIALYLITLAVKKLMCDKAASTDKAAEGGLVQESSQIILKDLSQTEWRETFDASRKEEPQQWKQHMETQLQDNYNDKIISKSPNNI